MSWWSDTSDSGTTSNSDDYAQGFNLFSSQLFGDEESSKNSSESTAFGNGLGINGLIDGRIGDDSLIGEDDDNSRGDDDDPMVSSLGNDEILGVLGEGSTIDKDDDLLIAGASNPNHLREDLPNLREDLLTKDLPNFIKDLSDLIEDKIAIEVSDPQNAILSYDQSTGKFTVNEKNLIQPQPDLLSTQEDEEPPDGLELF